MRIVSADMTAAWKSQLKAGSTKPYVRATIQRVRQKVTPYNIADVPGGDFGEDKPRMGYFTSVMFGHDTKVYEIPNIRSFSWSRSVNQDLAEATMVILNTELTPIGSQELAEQAEDFDLPGALTYSRGNETVEPNPWGYTTNLGWRNIFVPDRLVRTFEGYGVDLDSSPAFDANLMQSGTWLIDSVTYSATGDITLRMRDLGRVLVDQICFPPIIPRSEYPFWRVTIATVPYTERTPTGGSWGYPSGRASSSNDAYVGLGIVGKPSPYVDAHGGVSGLYPKDAITTREGDYYWHSTGQFSEHDKVWWQVDFYDKSTALSGVRLFPVGGPYKVYVSLYDKDKGWLGQRDIPYEVTTHGVDIEAGIPFVRSFLTERANVENYLFKKPYSNISKMRITMTMLTHSPPRRPPWHGALRHVKVYTAPNVSSLGFNEDGNGTKVIGRFRDYTEIVKWLCAWGGFYWPSESSGDNFLKLEDGTKTYWPPWYYDNVLPKGRVYGRFEQTGTAPIKEMTPEQFDKQPLLDAIGLIRDVVGFGFWIDEIGSIIWRMPNLWRLGNYITRPHLDPNRQWGLSTPEQIVVIDDQETLISYATVLDSSNLRERIFVASSTGKFGTVIKGFNPFPSNFRRIAGWTDGHFKTKRECKVMADMISAQQMFSYRNAKVTIPGYPAIQMDDQVRIYERVTNETYYHYVTGINSNLDMETGEWTYELDTHWLGENPTDAWVVRVDQLDGVTQSYLSLITTEPDA